MVFQSFSTLTAVFGFALMSTPVCKVSFVDERGGPLKVSIEAWPSEPNASLNTEPQWMHSDEKGFIEIPCNKNANEDGLCFVYAQGFAIDVLSTMFTRSRTMRVRMQSESDIQVTVVDEQGRPIRDARVCAGSIHFRESAWMLSPPFSLPAYLQSRTDDNGIAKLHGVIASQLKSVRIATRDDRGCTYTVPESWDAKSPIRIIWNPKLGTLQCRVVDLNGGPVVGAKLWGTTNKVVVNPAEIRKPTLDFNQYLGETGQDGSVVTANIPAIPLDIRFFSPDKSIGRGELLKGFRIEADKLNVAEFRFKQVASVMTSIVDVTDGRSHEGIEVRFALLDRNDYIVGSTKSNEDGIAEAELQQGEWRFSIEESSLPSGYCVISSDPFPRLTISTSNEIQAVAPIQIGRGRNIRGKILGLDPQDLRFDRLILGAKSSDSTWQSSFNDHGEFNATIPKEITDDSVGAFQVINGSQGTISIQSTNPWILKWTPNR